MKFHQHKSLSPFFSKTSKSKKQSWAKSFKKKTFVFLLQLSCILETYNLFNHKWWIHPAILLESWFSLNLSIFCLVYLFIIYIYIYTHNFLIPSICLILPFCCFAISLPRHCLIIVQEMLFFFPLDVDNVYGCQNI